MSQSRPRELFQHTLNRLVDQLSLTLVPGADGGPHMRLISQVPMAQGQVGEVNRYVGGGLFQLVTCSIVVPAIALDSHMLFAFTPSASAVPHFTLDSVRAGEHCAFHLDLIPRLDLGAQLAYMDQVFTPLSASHAKGSAIEGLSPAHLDPRQRAIMSPWMLANRATDAAFNEVGPVVDEYLEHWFGLMHSGIPASVLEGTTGAQLAARDQRNKAIIFNPDVDKVWAQIGGLIGAESSEALRNLLKSTDE